MKSQKHSSLFRFQIAQYQQLYDQTNVPILRKVLGRSLVIWFCVVGLFFTFSGLCAHAQTPLPINLVESFPVNTQGEKGFYAERFDGTNHVLLDKISTPPDPNIGEIWGTPDNNNFNIPLIDLAGGALFPEMPSGLIHMHPSSTAWAVFR